MRPLTRRAVLAQAWPVIVGQALIPTIGVVDAVVIGRTSDASALGGVALGVTSVNLAFWTFGFLRMGVTGFAAQARGAGDAENLRLILLRALILGFTIGSLLLMLSPLIVPAILGLMHVPVSAEESATQFTAARFLGAPAALAFYVINGWLLGMGQARTALFCQLAFNSVNIALTIVLVIAFDLGALGAGLGSSIAEWAAFLCGLWAVRRTLGGSWWRVPSRTLFDMTAYRRLIVVNADIMIRTMALLLIVSWFARAGARLGSVNLAANHVLMQFVSVSAFILDGFAFTAEAWIGAAIGARSRAGVLRAIRLTGEFCLVGSLGFAAVIASVGGDLIPLITRDPSVQARAVAMLPYCAIVPLIGIFSWLLDGIFLGAAKGRPMRNATVVSMALYLAVDHLLRPMGSDGVWIALLASYAFRAIFLGAALPQLLRDIGNDRSADAPRPTAPA